MRRSPWMIPYHVNNRVNYAFVDSGYGVILGQWLLEVSVSNAPHWRTQTQNMYTILGNLVHFRYVLMFMLFKSIV